MSKFFLVHEAFQREIEARTYISKMMQKSRNLDDFFILHVPQVVGFLVLRLHLICPRTGSLSRSIMSSIVDSEVQDRSKPKLENLEPRTQDLAMFWNSVLF